MINWFLELSHRRARLPKIAKDNLAFLSQRLQDFVWHPIELPTILASDQLAKCAKELAHEQKVSFIKKNSYPFSSYFRWIFKDTKHDYLILCHSLQDASTLLTGSEWIVDNFYLLEEHFRLSDHFFQTLKRSKLPTVLSGKFAGFPRIYELARTLVDNTDSLVNKDEIGIFIDVFQETAKLTLEELEAFPHFLRFVLLENLRGFAHINVAIYRQYNSALKIQDLLNIHGPTRKIEKIVKKQSIGTIVQLSPAFKEDPTAGAYCLQLIAHQCTISNSNLDSIIEHALRIRSACQMSIANIFATLRNITNLKWNTWFEHHSYIHALLQSDPTRIYELSEFQTREQCRQVIKRLSRKEPDIEAEITQSALRFAVQSESKEIAPVKFQSVVYYLIGDGVLLLERHLKYQSPLKLKVKRWFRHNILIICFISYLINMIVALMIPFFYQQLVGYGFWTLVFLGLLLLILASEVAMQVLQWLAAQFARPAALPKLDFHNDIPDDRRTLVCVHSILGDRNQIRKAVGDLKVRYLANRQQNIFFALMMDCEPASLKEKPEEQQLVDYAAELINRLNKNTESKNRFFLLFRHRSYSHTERQFIGWERKRGKLHQLNRLILGESGDMDFAAGDEVAIRTIRYVLTLDEDTVPPPETVLKLIETISHPLNEACLDAELNIVCEGYGIIQPRIATTLESSTQSYFATIFAYLPGLEPYDYTVSNLYQDLFEEGSYVGKAIYDVRVFEKTLAGRFPEGHILSHDLLEGLFARVGLASNLELLDQFPKNYISYARRLHRWIRGDWQLLPWLRTKIPTATGDKLRSPLSKLGRFKVFDNLRRSIVEPAAFFAFLASFSLLPGSPLFWTALIFFGLNFSLLISLGERLFSFAFFYSKRRHFIFEEKLRKVFLRALVHLSLLPMQAYINLHAIVITLYRILISRRHLLEWVTASDVEKKTSLKFAGFLKFMLPGVIAALASTIYCLLFFPGRFLYAAPILVAWICSPLIAYLLAKKSTIQRINLKRHDKRKLLNLAYDTIQYFREFARAQTNYLIPDNVQMTPEQKVALRTSPTNIGFHLQSLVSAYDLGCIFLPSLLDQINKVFESLSKLERFRGHFLNWYDITSLKPLYPRFVSTVDSGNLVANLITLKSALRNIVDTPIITKHHVYHLQQAAKLIESRESVPAPLFAEPKTIKQLKILFANIALIMQRIRHNEINNVSHHNIHFSIQFIEEAEQLRERLKPLFADDVLTQEAERICHHLISLPPTWRSLHNLCGHLDTEAKTNDAKEKLISLNSFFKGIDNIIYHLIEQSSDMINDIKFGFLYCDDERLFSIGYHVDTDKLDGNHYNLLASEACLTSLIAIAKNEIPSKHWFILGRALVQSSAGKTLLSWAGSVFEYLMPTIFFYLLPQTLLKQSYARCVKAQVNSGKKSGLPWGESEAAYAATDINGNFLYAPFGIAELGLKRDLADSSVVSPYSTFLSLHLDLDAGIKNISRLEKEGAREKYGFYESIDYTKNRIPLGTTSYIVRSFFAHHQGMIICALNNLLNDDILQTRFHQSSIIRSADLLLQERFPAFAQAVSLPKRSPAPVKKRTERSWLIKTPFTRFPVTHLSSNGTMSMMIDNAGSGYLFAGPDLALTNWAQDAVTNNNGYYVFIRDLDSNKYWSMGFQPSRAKPERYEVSYHPDRVIFRRKDFDIELHAEITVSPEYNAEIRKIEVTNVSKRERHLEITSYGEVVLEPLSAFQAHPVFSKLFVESKYRSECNSLFFIRKSRENESDLFLMHCLVGEKDTFVDQWEGSRVRFLGAGNNITRPAALMKGGALSNTTGWSLDPIFSLRTKLMLKAGHSRTVSFVTGFAHTTDDLEKLHAHYSSLQSIQRAFAMSHAHAEIESFYSHLPFKDFRAIQKLTKRLFYFLPKSKGGQEGTLRNTLHQRNLWRFGISGDLPIIFFRFTSSKQFLSLKAYLSAFIFLRSKQFHFDLFILNEFVEGYRQDVFNELQQHILLAVGGQADQPKTGKVVLQNVTQISEKETDLLATCAHLIVTADDGGLAFDDMVLSEQKSIISNIKQSIHSEEQRHELEFFNGYGGFIEGGKAYRIIPSKQKLVRPWNNVIGTKQFGFIISEKGGGYSWSDNSQMNCLTSRSEDPIIDPYSELIYVYDAKERSLFSPFPFPRESNKHVVEHHFGFSNISAQFDTVMSELTLSCSKARRIKWFHLKLSNLTEEIIKQDAFFYVDWVLGASRDKSAAHIHCSYHDMVELLTVQNNYRETFNRRISFIGSSEKITAFTSSKEEFIGRHNNLELPQLAAKNTISSGNDICGVLKVSLELLAHETKEIVFFMGEADSMEEAEDLAKQARRIDEFKSELQTIKKDWGSLTSTIQVKTPDRGFDILMNGWLVYQTLSCRLLARGSFYQASGAFGFRDQLQDVMALIVVNPTIAREQILLHASRQFKEGDVQHWWMPISGDGIRSRCSDDLLWLPYAVCHYLEKTDDLSILDEPIPFIEGEPIPEDKVDAYFRPNISSQTATIYQHCKLALDRSLLVGQHGLPLMQASDWNDGMNLVGIEGKGESVWLGWFLSDILARFSEVASYRKDEDTSKKFLEHQKQLLVNLERNAWDGSWYCRAFFDDGAPLGSHLNQDCKIDSISQSFSVIANGNDKSRQQQAMEAVYFHLVDSKNRVIKLLAPPFENATKNPGYIKAYPPGIRENGAQYTHAAAWVILAFAALNQGQRACDLFRLINPIYLTDSEGGVESYQAEPYVMAGDVYSMSPHTGKAGWSWYTGSSGWMFTVGLEYILGLKVRGKYFTVDPCVSSEWKSFQITYKIQNLVYEINVSNPNGAEKGVKSVKVMDELVEDKLIYFPPNTTTQKTIRVDVQMG